MKIEEIAKNIRNFGIGMVMLGFGLMALLFFVVVLIIIVGVL